MQSYEGTVRSGLGDHAQWIRKLKDHYERKTGVALFPGTLNVELGDEWFVPRDALTLDPAEYGGRVLIHIVPCRFMDREAWVLRTGANERGDGAHPRTVVEIASDLPLRATYGLEDGHRVTLDLP